MGPAPAPAPAHPDGVRPKPQSPSHGRDCLWGHPGCCVLSRQSGSTEVNQVQVHFSNTCELLSVTAKSNLLGEETPGFRNTLLFSSSAWLSCTSIHPSSWPARYSVRGRKLRRRKSSFLPLEIKPAVLLKDQVCGCSLNHSSLRVPGVLSM